VNDGVHALLAKTTQLIEKSKELASAVEEARSDLSELAGHFYTLGIEPVAGLISTAIQHCEPVQGSLRAIDDHLSAYQAQINPNN
jgi:hypothetical protein